LGDHVNISELTEYSIYKEIYTIFENSYKKILDINNLKFPKLKYIEYIINIGNFIPGVSLVSTILSFTIKSIESHLEIIKPFF